MTADRDLFEVRGGRIGTVGSFKHQIDAVDAARRALLEFPTVDCFRILRGYDVVELVERAAMDRGTPEARRLLDAWMSSLS